MRSSIRSFLSASDASLSEGGAGEARHFNKVCEDAADEFKWRRESGKKREFFGSPPSGLHPSSPHPSGPHAAGPHHLGPNFFQVCAPLLWAPNPSGPHSSGRHPSGPTLRPPGPQRSFFLSYFLLFLFLVHLLFLFLVIFSLNLSLFLCFFFLVFLCTCF